jgi:hypothetical protein
MNFILKYNNDEIIIDILKFKFLNEINKIKNFLSIYTNNIVIDIPYNVDIYQKLEHMTNYLNDMLIFKNEKELYIITEKSIIICHQPIIESLKICYNQNIKINIISGFIEQKISNVYLRKLKIEKIKNNLKIIVS